MSTLTSHEGHRVRLTFKCYVARLNWGRAYHARNWRRLNYWRGQLKKAEARLMQIDA